MRSHAFKLAVSVTTIVIATVASVDSSFAAKAKSVNVTASYASADDNNNANAGGISVSANKAKSKSGKNGKSSAKSGGFYAGYAQNTADNNNNGCYEIYSLSGNGSSTSRTAFTAGGSVSKATASSTHK